MSFRLFAQLSLFLLVSSWCLLFFLQLTQYKIINRYQNTYKLLQIHYRQSLPCVFIRHNSFNILALRCWSTEPLATLRSIMQFFLYFMHASGFGFILLVFNQILFFHEAFQVLARCNSLLNCEFIHSLIILIVTHLGRGAMRVPLC